MNDDDTAQVRVRAIGAADLDAVLELVSQIRSQDDLVASARRQFIRELESRQLEQARFIAECSGEIVGTMGCGPGPIPSKLALWADWLVVHSKCRRQRIASALYAQVEHFALKLGKRYLCLDIGNIDAQRAAYLFHVRNGFQIVGHLPDYWGEFEHLNLMTKTLNSEDRH